MQLKGTFQITNWQETVIHSFDSGAKLSKALVSQSYSGDINGSSEVHYQLSYESVKPYQSIFSNLTGISE